MPFVKERRFKFMPCTSISWTSFCSYVSHIFIWRIHSNFTQYNLLPIILPWTAPSIKVISLTSHFISWRKYHQSMSSLRSSCFSLFSPLLIYFCTRTMNLESDFKRRAQRKLSSGLIFKSTWECRSTPQNCLKPLDVVAVVLACDNDDGLTTCCCCSCLYAPW